MSPLEALVRASPWLMARLDDVRAVAPAWVAAGAVRDTVWNGLFHVPDQPLPGDVDVVFHDPTLDEGAIAAALASRRPDVRWEVVDQARIGDTRDLATSLARWPETATAVAVRLRDDDALDVIAPFGLDDLLGCVARWNPAVDRSVFERRIVEKAWVARWPALRVIR